MLLLISLTLAIPSILAVKSKTSLFTHITKVYAEDDENEDEHEEEEDEEEDDDYYETPQQQTATTTTQQTQPIPVIKDVLSVDPWAAFGLNFGYNLDGNLEQFDGANSLEFGVALPWKVNDIITVSGYVAYSYAFEDLYGITEPNTFWGGGKAPDGSGGAGSGNGGSAGWKAFSARCSITALSLPME